MPKKKVAEKPKTQAERIAEMDAADEKRETEEILAREKERSPFWLKG